MRGDQLARQWQLIQRLARSRAGCGLAGIAAAKAGARAVTANDIDRIALHAVALNAEANSVEIACDNADLTSWPGGSWDVIVAGDVCYERHPSEAIVGWLRRHAAGGATVLIGDPKRAYLPTSAIEPLVGYAARTEREVEDTDLRNAWVWRLEG